MTIEATPDLQVEEQTKLQKPRRYNCILVNDDFTPMDFVIMTLIEVFNHDPDSAVKIMLNVHHQGQGIAGTYIQEIANEKQEEVTARADAQGHPLLCRIEPADEA